MNQQQVEILWEVLERTDPGNVGGPAIEVLLDSGYRLAVHDIPWYALCDKVHTEQGSFAPDGVGTFTQAVIFFLLLVLAAEGEL